MAKRRCGSCARADGPWLMRVTGAVARFCGSKMCSRNIDAPACRKYRPVPGAKRERTTCAS